MDKNSILRIILFFAVIGLVALLINDFTNSGRP